MLSLSRRLSLLLLLLTASNTSTATTSPVLERYISSPEKVGEGRLTYLFWDVYDASLFASNGIWQAEQPFAIRLAYMRSIKGHQIADRSIEEIRQQGFRDEIKMATWHRQLSQILPDVEEGTILTGVFTEEKKTVFYQSNQKIGEITDPEFGNHFFAIWLSKETSAPKLRKQLLALP